MDDDHQHWVKARWAAVANACLPTEDEVKLLGGLPAEARRRIELDATRAEAEFHQQARGNHLYYEFGDEHSPDFLDSKKYELMGMCNRLAHRRLVVYFDELKVLPIHPSTIRRLLYLVVVRVYGQLFREKWRDYIPARPDDSESDEEEFVLTAIDHQSAVVEQYYAEALRIHEQRLAGLIAAGPGPGELHPSLSGVEPELDRRGKIDRLITNVSTATGRKIRRKDVSTVAGYRDDTQLQRFQRDDAQLTQAAVANFNRVLSMEPAEFIRALEKKRSN